MAKRTKVGIIGAGPAGLMLSQLLYLNGVESVILERRSRAYVEGRIRAGVLEPGTVELLTEARVDDRMYREGLPHDGFDLSFFGRRRRIDLKELTGEQVMVYGQTEITKDLIDTRLATGGELIFEAEVTEISDFDTSTPRLRYRKDGEDHELVCDFLAGCDGFHGISRASVPQDAIKVYEREFPFGWLGILAETPPVSDELIYVNHRRGFALCSMRSKRLSRYYIQCDLDENLDEWPDDRFWDALRERLDPETAETLVTGPSVEKSIAPLRSFACEPMRFGNLFLAGDAAHIVPPTGAKGLNLAAADARTLARALVEFYESGSTALMTAYSLTCLKRMWKAQRFSWWMTSMLHFFPENGRYGRRMQLAELDYVTSSRAGMMTIAENYIGLPFDEVPF